MHSGKLAAPFCTPFFGPKPKIQSNQLTLTKQTDRENCHKFRERRRDDFFQTDKNIFFWVM